MNGIPFISTTGLLAFALASVLYLFAVPRPGRQDWLYVTAFGLFVTGTLAITTTLVLMFRSGGTVDVAGLMLTSAIGWLAIGGHLQFRIRIIGALVAPLATLILLIQFFVAPPRASVAFSSADNLLIKVHVAMAVLGQAFAIMACAVSVVYLWQQRLLKQKLLAQLPENIPAIDRTQKMLTASLMTGFGFLTLGLLSGAVFTQMYAAPTDLALSWKVVWATIVWLWYLATLLARNVFNRPSRRIAQMALIGFLILALSYFGMGFFRAAGGLAG